MYCPWCQEFYVLHCNHKVIKILLHIWIWHTYTMHIQIQDNFSYIHTPEWISTLKYIKCNDIFFRCIWELMTTTTATHISTDIFFTHIQCKIITRNALNWLYPRTAQYDTKHTAHSRTARRICKWYIRLYFCALSFEGVQAPLDAVQ